MQVSFFLDNSRIADRDFSDPLAGNPGVGATEYMTVLISTCLNSRFGGVRLLVTATGNFPQNLTVRVVNNLEEAIANSAAHGEILVVRAFVNSDESWLRSLHQHPSARVVVWGHLTPTSAELDRVCSSEQILAFICLEKTQRQQILDFPRRDFFFRIPYGLPDVSRTHGSRTRTSKDVLYVGALVPQKGFHLLADVWPSIVAAHPDARLLVAGSSDLYGNQTTVQHRATIEPNYSERVFRHLDPNESSLHFLGRITASEIKLYAEASALGVVNPSGHTETFCLSAVELQQFGLPVIGAKVNGTRDTISHGKTGVLVGGQKQLAKSIIHLLEHKNLLGEMSINAEAWVRQKYLLDGILDLWTTLLMSLDPDRKASYDRKRLQTEKRSLSGLAITANRCLVEASNGRWPTRMRTRESLSSARHLVRRLSKKSLRSTV